MAVRISDCNCWVQRVAACIGMSTCVDGTNIACLSVCVIFNVAAPVLTVV